MIQDEHTKTCTGAGCERPGQRLTDDIVDMVLEVLNRLVLLHVL